jgi:hypothetical protein
VRYFAGHPLPRLVAERGWPAFRPRVYIALSAMMGRLGHMVVNNLDNGQAAKLNFGALQVSFPCLHFEVGSNPHGMVSQVNLTDFAVRCAFGPYPRCQLFLGTSR